MQPVHTGPKKALRQRFIKNYYTNQDLFKRTVVILVRMTLSAIIELFPSSDLSSRDPNCQHDIQLFLQQFEKFSMYCVTNWHYKVLGVKQTSEWHFTHLRYQLDSFSNNCNSISTSIVQELSHPIHFNTSESHSHMFSSLFRCLYINQCKFHSISHFTFTAMWLHLLE